MNDRQVVLIGSGGHAKVVIDTLRAAGRTVAGVLDDDPELSGAYTLGVPVLGKTALAPALSYFDAIVAVGDNALRRKLVERGGMQWTVAVHPSVPIPPGVVIGGGSVIFAGSVIQPGARIGAHVIVNTGVTVDHDCTIGDFAHLAPGVHLGGGVSISEGAFAGIASVVLPNLNIGEWATLGGGAVAIRNIEAHTVAVGVPARPIRSRSARKRAPAPVESEPQPAAQALPYRQRAGLLDVGFQVWDAVEDRDRRAWLRLWEQWPEREIFAHPDYVRLYAGPNARPFCATASSKGNSVLYPFLLRPLGGLPYCDESLRDWADIATPYGYGGAYLLGDDPWGLEATAAFWGAFEAWATKSRVVSEIVRQSLNSKALLDHPAEFYSPVNNVVRVLESEAEVWRDFKYKVRKNVNKARECGVQVQIDLTGDRLDDFYSIYIGTMDRRSAERLYYFPREYFERINTDLRGHFAYFHALVGGVVVSTELVLCSADRVYSFLGGTDSSWFHVRPNELLKLEIMNWARRAGKKEFVLGGGYSRGDGIYHFKLAFAPGGSVPFQVGRRVLNAGVYERLVQSRMAFAASQGRTWEPRPEYFPAYRS